ncbi:MAG: sigma-70 family RNA polymerase sigma factor [Planctomycetes bacterium]|nr:sigma-70 family RNA polymerase sigma factor [Planctomycetota bacterium]MBI3847027.1 sigma-70 family RNA polymerase sigma factor [Planctomycetota bacterium]
MGDSTSERVTALLSKIDRGSGEAIRELFPIVYAELRHLARGLVAKEPGAPSIQATALVHEAFVKLVQQRSIGFRDRIQFFGVAAQAMRRILVDHARTRGRAKRSGGAEPLTLHEAAAVFEERALDLVALDVALDELSTLDARKARLVELRFFGGLDMREAAALLDVPLRTAERDWTAARAYLRSRLDDE